MKHVILYDGVCVLCSRSIRFVLDRDPGGRFAFAPLQSESAQRYLERHGQTSDALDSVWVLEDYGRPTERALRRGPAALLIMKELPSPWPLVAALLRALPGVLLNLGYEAVAKTRYRVFGKLDRCALPPAEHRNRFIEL